MKGPGSKSSGAVPFTWEQSILTAVLRLSWSAENPYRKFSGAQPEDLCLTESFLARFPGVSEKKIRREYCKLPKAFQQTMSFAYDLGWPEVDLFRLFLGSSCPGNSLIKGAEVLAEEGCCRIRHKALVAQLKLRHQKHLTEGDIEDLLDSAEDGTALILALAERMEKDLRSAWRYLQKDDRPLLTILLSEVREHEVLAERKELRDKIIQFYQKIRPAYGGGGQTKKSSNVPTKKTTDKKIEAERKERRRANIARKKYLAQIPASLRPLPEITFDTEELSFQNIVKRKPSWLKKIQATKTSAQKTEKQPERKAFQTSPSDVGGWKKAFLKMELGIKTPISQESWGEAFGKLLGFEKDVVRFRFARGKSFTDFSCQKYGTAGGARKAYESAKRKLLEALLRS